MPTFAATLKNEIQRISAQEVKKTTLRPLRRLARQMKAARRLARTQGATIGRVQRRLERVRLSGATSRRRRIDTGPRVPPAAIRTLRKRLKMTRVLFAKLVGVSPGSIFGWETGRSTPRGHSRQRLIEIRGTARADGEPLGVRAPRRAVRKTITGARGRRAARTRSTR